MHILNLSQFLAEVVYTPEFWNKIFVKFFTTKLESLIECFKQKVIFFNVTLIIKTFLSKSIKKTLYKPYKAIMHQYKDQLILVKYWLNFTKVENWVNQY